MKDNDHIERINNLLIELASGNFNYKEDISGNNDEFDAIITGINMLGEELEASTVSRDYLKSIYKGVVDMLIVLNPDNTIQNINSAVTRLLGFNEQDLLGKHISILFSEDDNALLVKTNEELFKRGICYNIERKMRDKSNEIVPVSCSCSLLWDKKQRLNGILYIAKDISKLKRAEQELKTINQELNTFVYKASHDLKGPIASIIGLAGIAEEDIQSANSANVTDISTQYFNLIKESAKILESNLINLIEVTYLKQAGLNMEMVDLNELVEKILSTLRHVKGYEKVQVTIDIKQEQEFYSDLKLLKSVLQNLIENAFKYRNEKAAESWVHIELKHNTKTTEISISDNGLGIPDEFRDRVFDMFFRASKKSSGSGLGLYLVRNSVEKLGGEIDFESSDNGTTFFIKLPHLKPAEAVLQ